MNRQIKFRAWNEQEKRWCTCAEANRINFNPHVDKYGGGKDIEVDYVDEDNCGASPLEHNSIILEQLTGLLDKNGKEIYEGDILTAPAIKSYKPIFIVVYVEYDTAFSAFDLQAQCWVKLNALEYKIIGNIHENLELLEIKNG